jgi:hypothetical protein
LAVSQRPVLGSNGLAGFLGDFFLTLSFTMVEESLKNLTTEELKTLFTSETRRLAQRIDNGLPFDKLKEIRIKLREIETELHERGISL